MSKNSFKCPFENWSIIELIGQGGQGVVYKAVRQDKYAGDEYAAIKVITEIAEQEVNKVVKEIKNLLKVKGSPNILHIEDYKIEKNNANDTYSIYIRTALYTPLKIYLKQHIFTENDVLHLAENICTALEHCHKENIIHRDIKPNNILFNEDNNLFYLCDFGIAQRLEGTTTILTGVGTPDYVAPESYRGKYDNRSDIYSFGLVLYWLMNDSFFPFKSDDISEYIRPIREKNYKILPPPSKASKELSSIILKACNYFPENRYSSISEMESDLLKLFQKRASVLSTGASVTEPLNNIAHNLGEGASRTAPIATPFYDTYSKSSSESTIKYNFNNDELPKDSDDLTTQSNAHQGMYTPNNDYSSNEYSQTSKKVKRKLNIPNIIIAFLLLIILVLFLLIFKKSDSQNEGIVSDKVHTTIPDTSVIEEKTTDKTQEIENNINSIIDNAETLVNKHSYEEALNKINEGLIDYPDSYKLKYRKTDLEKKVNIVHDNEAAISTAKEMVEQNDLVSAIHLIDETKNKSENGGVYDEKLTQALVEYTNTYVKQAMNQADEFAGNNNFDSAVEVLSKAKTDLPDNNTLSAKLSQVEADKKKYDLSIKKEQILKEAEEAFNSQGYESALSLLQSVSELSSDPDIKARIDEYQEYKPVSLFTLDYFDSDGEVYGPSDPKDNLGNRHPNSYEIHTPRTYHDAYVTYRVDGKYTHLRGTFFLLYDYRSSKSVSRFNVYNDEGEIIYTTTITHGVDPVDFDIDISGIKNLKIEFKTDFSNGIAKRDCAFSDVTISK